MYAKIIKYKTSKKNIIYFLEKYFINYQIIIFEINITFFYEKGIFFIKNKVDLYFIKNQNNYFNSTLPIQLEFLFYNK